MKRIRIPALAIVLSSLLILAACKKDNDPKPINLGGTTWVDSAMVGLVKYKPFTLAFKEDGTMTATFPGFSPFPGYWNKLPESSVVNIYFTESPTSTWKGQGTLNNANTKIESGILTRLTPSVITGTFSVTKQ